MSLTQTLYMTQTCNVTKLPVAGESQPTVIAEALKCSAPYPKAFQNFETATGWDGYQMFTELNQDVKNNHIVEVMGLEFAIKQARPWPARPPHHDGLLELHLELRR